ncbi:RRXRR domain-containing protein [Streptomyces sp. NPDC002787]
MEAAENGDGDVPTQGHAYAGGIGAGRVYVLSKGGKPLMPCHPARARELLEKGRAVVAQQVPFTIRLKDRTLAESEVDGVQLRTEQATLRVRHRGPGTGNCAVRKVGGHMDRADLCPSPGPAQSDHTTRPDQRQPLESAAAAARRRLQLRNNPDGHHRVILSENRLSTSRPLPTVGAT